MIQFGLGHPSDRVVFGGGKFGFRTAALDGAGEVDHPDVFVGCVDAVNVEESRSDQGPGAWFRDGRPITDQFYEKAALFPGLSQGGLLGIFVQFDVPAQGKPFTEFPVVNQQYPAPVHDEDGHSKIDQVMEMCHKSEVVGRRTIWRMDFPPGGAPAAQDRSKEGAKRQF